MQLERAILRDHSLNGRNRDRVIITSERFLSVMSHFLHLVDESFILVSLRVDSLHMYSCIEKKSIDEPLNFSLYIWTDGLINGRSQKCHPTGSIRPGCLASLILNAYLGRIWTGLHVSVMSDPTYQTNPKSIQIIPNLANYVIFHFPLLPCPKPDLP